ncbi:MAG: type II secretion system protein [Sedimentisphaerales bacterium]|jgi:prepilin-type processing-associated H-X9-DG protein/prepilin-type N-terminal cleavage/methylation domain-containing protein
MRNRAFTIVELLVVISVVAVLMAILMPALAGARQRGQAVVCLSNLRQLAIASQLYVNSNDGFYPIAYMNKLTDSEFVSYAWDFTRIQKFSPFEQEVIPGLLWEGQTIEKVQQCPSFKGDATWLLDPYTGYNYNVSFIGHGQLETCVTPTRATSIRRPDRCALFGDGQFSDGANKFMRSPWQSECDEFSDRYAGTQGYRHYGRTNVAYCDGHTAAVKECYKNTYDDQVAEIAEGTGFLSPDNSAYDLK